MGFVAQGNAYAQRRGRMVIPQRPVNVDSSSMINGLNKALNALGATDRDYDGHRAKAITHINNAIRDLEVPSPDGKGKSNPSTDKEPADKPSSGTPTTSQADSDASISKALKALFAVHHELADKASTRGRIHADAEVRIAIQELVEAQKTAKPAAPPGNAAAPGAKPDR
jgi:hypothetical protein